MIGMDFPVKPEWIHDVHALWQPEQPVSDLVQAALAQTMQELGGEKTRRNSLSIILRYFVETVGGGQSRRTAAQDVWVAYSRAYRASTMAPAYLAHLIAQNEVAQEASAYIVRRYGPGETLNSSELRRHVVGLFGERKVVINASNAFLRSLYFFGALASEDKLGQYRLAEPLAVECGVFPLLVWAWWQKHLAPQIDLDRFAQDPAAAFLETGEFGAYWRAYQPLLWVLEERLEVRRATLKYVEGEAFQRALANVADSNQ